MTDFAVLGIDPGASGGLALVIPSLARVHTLRMPTHIVGAWRVPDTGWVDDWLQEHQVQLAMTVLEQPPRALAGSKSSCMAQGATFGCLYHWAEARGPVRLPTPQDWQRRVIRGKLPSKDSKALKESVKSWARVTYPHADLVASESKSAKTHDGIADALALAHYGILEMTALSCTQ